METEAELCAGSKPSSVTVNRRSLLGTRSQTPSQSQAGSPRASDGVLGPIIFMAYINDFPKDIVSQVRLFTDDTAIYLTLEHQGDSDKLQKDLDRLQTWEARWDMEFNPSKCQVVRVTSSRDPLQTQYIRHGQVLEAVRSARYLGWISPATSSGIFMWTESQTTQIGHSDLLGVMLRLSPHKSGKWHINPLSVPAGVCFSSLGPPY